MRLDIGPEIAHMHKVRQTTFSVIRNRICKAARPIRSGPNGESKTNIVRERLSISALSYDQVPLRRHPQNLDLQSVSRAVGTRVPGQGRECTA